MKLFLGLNDNNNNKKNQYEITIKPHNQGFFFYDSNNGVITKSLHHL